MAHLNADVTQARISQRLLRYKRFMLHLVATVVVAVGLAVAVDRFGMPGNVQDILSPVVVLLLLAHAFWLMYAESATAITRQEMQAGQGNLEWEEKPKNDTQLAIGEDGELVEIIGEDEVYPDKRKRG